MCCNKKSLLTHPVKSVLVPTSLNVMSMFRVLLISAHYTFFCSLLFVISYTRLPDKLSAEDRSLKNRDLEEGVPCLQPPSKFDPLLPAPFFSLSLLPILTLCAQ